MPKSKKAKTEGLSYREAAASVKIAVACSDYPATQMDQEKLTATQKAIMEAYESIPEEGPQVRFVKCTHRPGYLVIACADNESAQWLRNVVPAITPWEGASLIALEGDDIPKPLACTAFVPDEYGQKIPAERILARLRISNRKLKTGLWTVWGSTPMEKGTLWTFSIDKESQEELKRWDMCPYFGMGRLKFRVKDSSKQQPSGNKEAIPVATTSTVDAAPQGTAEEETIDPSGSPTHQDQLSESGISPLKRFPTQELAVPMEEDKVEEGESTGEEDPSSE